MKVIEHPCISIEDYLAYEKDGQIRHEYVDGYIYAMTGASATHNRIALNCASGLLERAGDQGCEVFISDMKLSITVWNCFYYPDVMICCDKQDDDDYSRQNPCLIVEVLSPSTVGIDRREKLKAYQQLPSLLDYVLIDQEQQMIEVYRRREDHWIKEELTSDDELYIQCVDEHLPVSQLYTGIQL
jgi:Uma2 family endonuclease